MTHKKRMLCSLLCMVLLILSCQNTKAAKNQENEQEKLNLYARSAVLMDGSSGRILYGQNEKAPLPMASTTKIMTCILVLEQMAPGEICRTTKKAAAAPKVKLGMQEGDIYYSRDLLYSLMLESHNDTAICLAEQMAGSVERFSDWMNSKAEQIGCTDTFFLTPNGLDEEKNGKLHHTTAADLAAILRYCITKSTKAEEFLHITQTQTYEFCDVSGKKRFHCTNHNAFLTMMDGALTGKTGFTARAGYCYVGALKREDRLLIVSLLGCGWPGHRSWKWMDTRKLMEYGLREYRTETVDKRLSLSPVPVQNGVRKEVCVCAEREPVPVLLSGKERIQWDVHIKKELEAPVEAGETVGTIRYRIGSFCYDTVPVKTSEESGRITFSYCLNAMWECLLI